MSQPTQESEHAVLNQEPVKSESNMPDTEKRKSLESDSPSDSNVEKAPAVPNWADPASFPDGGRKAWLTVLGASCCLFVSFGWINCIGVFQDYYESHQLRDYTASEVAWIPSLQVFMMLAGGPITGYFYDTTGPRYLLAIGSFFHVFGLMMTSISKKYYSILLSQAICSALGSSFVFYPAMSSVSTWFFHKRGQALGMTAAGSSLGGVIFPIMVSHLVKEVGFGWTMRICAFLILALLIVANLTVTARIPPRPRKFEFGAFVRPLKEMPFLLLTLGVFFFYWGMFFPFSFIVVEAISKGMSPRLATYLVSILNGASIIGRTVPNIVADKKLGRFNMMVLMGGLTSILILALWIPANSNAAIIVFAALFGIASGAGIGLTPALVAQVSPIREIGVRQGTVFFISSWAALTGSPIGGAILGDVHGDFKYPAIFAGLACLVGVCFFAAARINLGGFKITKV